MDDLETRLELRSLAQFQQLWNTDPGLRDAALAAHIVEHARLHGIHSGFLGHVPPGAIEAMGTDHRENFMAGGFNARQRCILDLLAEFAPLPRRLDARIHLHEGVTQFALALRGRYPLALCSEYLPTPADQAARFPIQHVDVTESRLPTGAFDLIVSNEVLEHVPDLDAALRDMARILRPGGRLIGTLPLAFGSEEGILRARKAADGSIEHLLPAEYHGNPIDPEGGSLVFEVPGWNLLARARSAGFRDAMLIFDRSVRRGITAGDITGILAFVAQR